MKLYNTLSQKIEPFRPQGDAVAVYVCGITPYDTTHLGHAFTYTSADVLIRYLEHKGHPVRYVQNVTDIDDDILRRAKKAGENWRKLGDHWTTYFIRDMQALNVRPPDFFPRATDVITEIVQAVEQLIAAGVAYESGGSVFFEVKAWPEYGKLSRLPRIKMLPIANERGNNPDDPRKRAPLDFVLWQAQVPGEPAWDSPWGSGRPGWHIECSTMATHFLGETIDIHSGGGDLVFPHHESEIAQTEPVNGRRPYARFWMHMAMVGHEGEKMSKSLGNLVMVRDLLKSWSPDALRLYMGSHHYRRPWTHDGKALAKAEELAGKLRTAATIGGGRGTYFHLSQLPIEFDQAMDQDLDTPAALKSLEAMADETLFAVRAGRQVKAAQNTLRAVCRIFGLRLDAPGPEERVQAGWDKHQLRFSEERKPPGE